MTTLGTLLYTMLKGRMVGTDTAGNTYYVERRGAKGRPARRWVIYGGRTEASAVPPEWHAWLHYTVDKPLTDVVPAPWQKPYEPNQTGGANAYLPPGHDLMGGRRERATGDYEGWRP
ncbi:NADH:ubiquinone oxidoreductase subunit NDUFA12 [Magnetospirillum sp. UT-4]|uniref:NADH:ubiquinone oxidoreductase subunit NDUFA12 n=1 Tax=Magnetospirillum sp. UT-4 TaxID=2681467 RepID=UPI0013858326|nr:NADH:ubiquinone oxidoreductase subunit NDUFA12 [Magnetospirillum sp. UT-4]CAA7615215.1 NADH:ubiquinone oxidoreductase 172 kD subunit [Magnetospirillum sp. UT-4]